MCRGCRTAALDVLGCGTVASYRRGCRCDACRDATSTTMREYVAKRRNEGRPIKRERRRPLDYRRYSLSDADRMAIFERDGWICQICNNELDRTVDHNHPMSPTLDHIEPQSLALIPDHRPSNLRAAHRRCNASRGNRIEVAAC